MVDLERRENLLLDKIAELIYERDNLIIRVTELIHQLEEQP